jgi:hypothetical protein
MSVLTQTLADVVALLIEREVKKAVEILDAAVAQLNLCSLEQRQRSIEEINLTLLTMKSQAKAIRTAIDALPAGLRLQAEHGLLPVLDRVLHYPAAELRTAKRRQSRPS